MIVVTGATGTLGRIIVEKLCSKRAAGQIGVGVRDVSKAAYLADRGVRVRQSDYADVTSLLRAFEGASQVLIISSNSSGTAAVEYHINAIQAAKQAGARRVLYTSHMGASATSQFAPMRDHAATEEVLNDSGLPFTALRNGFYASSAIMMMGQFLKTGTVVAPPDGAVSWTAHGDLADAAVLALTEEGKLNGITPPLTGSEALNLAQLAALTAELTGRETGRKTVSDKEQRSSMLARGTPETVADLFGGLYKASRVNEFAKVDATLERLLGRPPVRMRQVLMDFIKTQDPGTV